MKLSHRENFNNTARLETTIAVKCIHIASIRRGSLFGPSLDGAPRTRLEEPETRLEGGSLIWRIVDQLCWYLQSTQGWGTCIELVVEVREAVCYLLVQKCMELYAQGVSGSPSV